MRLPLLPLLALLALSSPAAAEADDTKAGATPIEKFGTGKLASSVDVDWWRLRRNHKQNAYLYIETGVGALCGCPKGDPFIVDLEVYDNSGVLLFSYVAPSAGHVNLLLQNLPMGDPVFLRLTGVTVGGYGWSEYKMQVY